MKNCLLLQCCTQLRSTPLQASRWLSTASVEANLRSGRGTLKKLALLPRPRRSRYVELRDSCCSAYPMLCGVLRAPWQAANRQETSVLSGIAFWCNNVTPCICDLLEYVTVGLKITLPELHPYFPMLSIHAHSFYSITYFPFCSTRIWGSGLWSLSVYGKGSTWKWNEKWECGIS